ncbi:MAG: hypothetical protein EOO68_38885 [Moraxellaceae bacterium]|nr:MAG: hypothetical protein EOO68_38885 [Moraxellaceae bacterium]
MSQSPSTRHQNRPQQPRTLKVVAVSGGLNTPSKTESLIDAILAELHHALDIEVHYIKLSEIGTGLGGVISRNDLPANVQHALATIETADALIVGTPVYRASFTGLFKHLFDFVDQFALVDIYESGEIPCQLFPELIVPHERIFR